MLLVYENAESSRSRRFTFFGRVRRVCALLGLGRRALGASCESAGAANAKIRAHVNTMMKKLIDLCEFCIIVPPKLKRFYPSVQIVAKKFNNKL